MDPFWWSIVLLLAGAVFLFLEFFLPTGGVLGAVSISAFVASVAMAFYYGGMGTGTMMVVVVAVLVPVLLKGLITLWPNTPLGRRMLIRDEDRAFGAGPDPMIRRRQLIGRRGVAKSRLLPSGAVLIDGEVLSARSEGMPIDPGAWIEVVKVDGIQIVVRAIDDRASPPKDDRDILSQPIESLGFDPFDEDPLA